MAGTDNDPAFGTVWVPTNALRKCNGVLQQEWVNQYGEGEWRDVPEVEQ